jgi:TetR/AcrR family transcriptional regulator, copper-responsive repressor
MLEEKRTAPRPRGRPRAYDPDRALAAAMQAFWRLGYAGTSLEELSAATDMNRPSMYAAFGDKRTLYRKTLDSYIATAQAKLASIFDSAATFADGLTEFFKAALAWYVPEDGPPRGCYLIATAATECLLDESVKLRMQEAFDSFDAMLEQRVRRAQAAGELSPQAEPAVLASMVLAMNHSLALRARAGVARSALETLIRGAVRAVCGPTTC